MVLCEMDFQLNFKINGNEEVHINIDQTEHYLLTSKFFSLYYLCMFIIDILIRVHWSKTL